MQLKRSPLPVLPPRNIWWFCPASGPDLFIRSNPRNAPHDLRHQGSDPPEYGVFYADPE
jgi:hypothetical protein